MSTQQSASENTHDSQSPRAKKRWMRLFLLALGPVVVIVVSAYMYWHGGRFVNTDNAYLQADKVAISAEVKGAIVELLVKENDYIEKGTPVCKIDNRSYFIALEQAKARLQQALAEIRVLKASYRQKGNELALAKTNIEFARKEYTRQANLNSNQATAKAQFDDSEHNLQVSQYRLAIIQTEMDQILAELEGDAEIPADKLASYRLAQATVERAALDLEKTVVLAPFSGRVSKIPKTGKHVEPGTPVMSLIAEANFWIEANLKETELTRVQPGQKVAIEVDTYPDHEFSGTVQSVSPGTGSEFSIIPAQNATGNWVKVVQRIPVRISVDDQSSRLVLRSGLSARVRIDTEYSRSLPDWLRKSLATGGISRKVMAAQAEQAEHK